MPNEMNRGFIFSVATMLMLTATAKIWSALGHSGFLGERDPILGISVGSLLIIAATLELGVAAVCLFRPVLDGWLAVAWLSTVFLSYRIGLWWTGWQKPCACLGNLTDALHISPQLADNVMKGLLAFMLIGSVSLLILHRRRSECRPGGGSASVTAESNAKTNGSNGITAKTRTFGRLFSAMVLVSSWLMACQSSAQDFEVRGHFEGHTNAEGVTNQLFRYEFEIVKAGRNWKMIATDTNMRNTNDVPLARRREFATDGTNIYGYTQVRNPITAEKTEQASVSPGVTPAFDENLRVLWLVYLSGDYIDKNGGKGLPVPFDSRLVNAIAHVETNSATGRSFHFYSAQKPTEAKQRGLLGELLTTSVSNLNLSLIPTSFVLALYQNRDGNELNKSAEHIGIVTYLSATTVDHVRLPEVPLGTPVLDRRFGSHAKHGPFIVN